ncbi:MAG: hypothetical protein K2K53_07505 [Oscillospiraceae bacterium]|nr:hypothetical protein [Oscillospiraceae bacterium]
MASEYLKWKYRDVKPAEKVELTRSEKRKNWWYYHKWHVVIGVVLAGIGINILCHALGLGQIRPDYQIAYVGDNALPDDTAAAIEAAFASLGEDLNGDGRITVRLNQYASTGGFDAEMAVSAEVTLMADIMNRDSYFFLLENPAWFQVNYRSLRRLDGSLPPEGDYSADGTYLAWGDCPALANMELGSYSYQAVGNTVTGSSDELAAGLSVARRGFWTGESCKYPEGCDALWDKLVEGAVQ